MPHFMTLLVMWAQKLYFQYTAKLGSSVVDSSRVVHYHKTTDRKLCVLEPPHVTLKLHSNTLLIHHLLTASLMH